MDQELNRVATELKSWRKREERFTALFPNALTKNRGFQLEKLSHLEAIKVRYKGTANPDERLTLRILKEQKKELEKKLYPNFIYRLARRLIVSLVIQNREIRRANGTAQSVGRVKEKLKGLGMDHLNSRLDEQLKSGMDNIKIPFTSQLSEKEKMSVELSINKDQDGHYVVAGYRSELHGPGNDKKTHFFREQDGTLISPEKSYQLLSGRAVQVGEEGSRQWVQFDFNDKDAAGNYRLKQFSKSLDFDLGAAVKKLPVVQLLNGMKGLLKELTEGRRVEVKIKKGDEERKLSIEASPQSRGINIYDDCGKKISLDSALKEKTNPIIVSLKPDQAEKAEIKKSTGRKI